MEKGGRFCFLYPGQGAQFPGMGKDLWESHDRVKDLFRTASEITGLDMESLLITEPSDDINRTDITQPVVTLVNCSVRIALEERGITSSGCAGFSLGEYAALLDAGVLSVETLFQLVGRRGELMHLAGERARSGDSPPGMAAVIGLTAGRVDELLEGCSGEVYPANYNSPTQTVIAGTAEGISEAEEICTREGARRFIRLKVSGPFHSPLMEEARAEFAEVLEEATLQPPQKSLYSNVTGGIVESGEEVRRLLLEQIVAPVRWVDEERNIVAEGYDTVIETGPGKVLTGLWKSIEGVPSCLPCGTMEQIEALSTTA